MSVLHQFLTTYNQEYGETLYNLKYNNESLLNEYDRNGLYNMLAFLDKVGWKQGIEHIQQLNQKYPNLTTAQFLRTIIFESSLFKKERDKSLTDMNKYRRKMRSAPGLYTCKNCGSKNTIAVQKQLRSADEPMTTIITCVMCNKTWREG
jgi:DNA-directed RNA polymerase subunit M/transcription elongation factor TFIIS